MKGLKYNLVQKIGASLLGLLVLSACGSTLPPKQGGDSNTTVATVNGEPILEAEFRLARSLSDFQAGPQNNQALDRMIRVKLVQLEGVKYGLLPSASYASFQTRLTQENERRLQALERKEAIYGPRQYTEQTYYSDEFSRLQIGLKEKLSRTVLDLSEDKLRQEYEKRKQGYAIQPTLVLRVWSEPMQPDADGALQRMKSLQQDVKEGKETGDLLSNKRGASTKAVEETVSEENKRSYMKYRGAFFEQANRLQEGQFSDILIDQDRYVMIYCSSRSERGFKTFEQVRNEVYNTTLDHQFEAYIDKLMESAVISGSP